MPRKPKTHLRLGSAIRQAREDAGLKREQLAVMADVSYSTLVNYETGESPPKLDTMIRLARVVGKSVDHFVEAVEEDERELQPVGSTVVPLVPAPAERAPRKNPPRRRRASDEQDPPSTGIVLPFPWIPEPAYLIPLEATG